MTMDCSALIFQIPLSPSGPVPAIPVPTNRKRNNKKRTDCLSILFFCLFLGLQTILCPYLKMASYGKLHAGQWLIVTEYEGGEFAVCM